MTSEKPVQLQSSSSVGGETATDNTDSSLGGRLTGTLQGVVNKTVTVGGNVMDRYLPPPQKRERWKTQIITFATERPYLAGFLASQIALSGLPLILFICITVSVFIFSLLAGILVGIIGGLLFVVPVIGFALLVLIPVMFFTTAAAVCIWFWALVAYTIIDYFNHQKETSSKAQNGEDVKMKNSSSNGAPPQTTKQGTKDLSTLGSAAEAVDPEAQPNSSSDGGTQSRRHTPSNSSGSGTSNSNSSSGGGGGGAGNNPAPQQHQ
ncbi:hypothetical protein H2204_004283 [Knufia peltigerae]|uniref:Uncharacterized protein n=1 Tax=Knufia peltigerae TaxID=1002370 RepID=A0AA38Y7L4_9EURO|nr:hypothetical protein H2204_004283 [Knufia peltigerae]